MKIYCLVRIEDINGIITVDPMGIYEDLEDVMAWIDQLQALSADINVVYDVLDFEKNHEPYLLTHMREEKEKIVDSVNDALSALMKKGYIDQLVGEDGNFYYDLTAKGKSVPSSAIIKKFIINKKF